MSKAYMSKRLKKKAILVVIVEIICVIAFGLFLTYMQETLSANSNKSVLIKKSEPLAQAVADANAEGLENMEQYDAMYRSKAANMAYMVQEEIGGEVSNSLLKEWKTLLNVNNVLILDKEGNVLYQAEESPADFTRARYNQLRSVFTTDDTSKPFKVEKDGQSYRYYGAKIDSNSMAVIEMDPQELQDLLDSTYTWKSVLEKVSVGTTGYAFAVSATDYTFKYHPDEELVGADALDCGLNVEDLDDGHYGWLTVNDERLLCSVTEIENTYVVCAIPEKEINSSSYVTVGVVLFVFFVVVTLIVVYSIFALQDHESSEDRVRKNYKKIFGFYFNKAVGTKIGVISIIGVLCILFSSLYMQTLFALSRQSMSNNTHVEEVQDTVELYQEQIQTLEDQYDTRYLNKARAAAYVITQKPALETKEDLGKLSEILDVESVSVFNEEGTIVASNTSNLNFSLSQDEDDQSYEFWKLLSGAEYVIQEAGPDDLLGEYSQYIGVALHDEEGMPNGFVQICVNPDRLEEAEENLTIKSVLDGVQVGSKGFAFAVNKDDDYTFAYYPTEKYIGRSSTDYGLTESQIKDGFNDYIEINNVRYYASCLETESYFVYVAVPVTQIATTKIPVALLSAAAALICLLIVDLILAFRGRSFWKYYKKEIEERDRMFTTVMPDGTEKTTESAASRFSFVTVKWDEKAPEQKMNVVFNGMMMVVAFLVLVCYVFKDKLFDDNSMFRYIANGTWQRGINIFAFTGCVLIICCVLAVTLIIQKILQLLSQALTAKGETICRLLNNFVKYASGVILLYYCFALFGVDTKTLLASAGIIGLMISLGAQKLVSDVLAGLFIIFEGEFRVGDIVTIDGTRGTVIEIGIRTTKIQDGNNNIKVISNSAISGVVNMTSQHSVASCSYNFSSKESLENIEAILKEALPEIRKRIPKAIKGPTYDGVSSIENGKITIGVSAHCSENDRGDVMKQINREIKLLFEQHGILIK